MTNLYKVYASVHNSELKQEITESRDSVSEMNLSGMTDSDLVEISESIIENLFTTGYSEDVVHNAVSQVFETFYESVGSERRKEKLERLSESFNKAFNKVYSFAESNSTEAFINYRKGRVISEKWNNKVSHEHGNERLHAALISEESHLVKSVLTRMITDIAEGDKSYLEKDMKKRQANNEKARKELAKGPQMKNPAFEEVSTLRQGWGDAYSAIYEKKLDAVGKEDGDIDNDGDEDSSDKYLKKRRKAIGKALGKKDDCEKCDHDDSDGDGGMGEGFIPIDKAKQTKIDRQIGRAADKESIEQGKSKKYGRDEKKIEKQYQRQQAMRFGKKMKKEEVSFSEAELARIEEIVNSWEG